MVEMDGRESDRDADFLMSTDLDLDYDGSPMGGVTRRDRFAGVGPDEVKDHFASFSTFREALQQTVSTDVHKGYENLLVRHEDQNGKAKAAEESHQPAPPLLPDKWRAVQGMDDTGKPVWKVFDEHFVYQPGRDVPITKPDTPAKPAETEKKIVTTARRENLSEEELQQLDKLEEGYLNDVLSKAMKTVREKMGDIRHKNMVPYESREIEGLMRELTAFRSSLQMTLERSKEGTEENPRAKEILGRIDAMNDWVEGNVRLYLMGGPLTGMFFDGWNSLRGAARGAREDITGLGLDKKFAGALADRKDMKIAREVIRKQDQMYEIYRGIAAVHRGKARNKGESIENDYTAGGTRQATEHGADISVDEVVEKRRAQFIEEIMKHDRPAEVKQVDDEFINEWQDNTIDSNPQFHKGIVWKVDGREVQFTRANLERWKREGKVISKEVAYVETIGDILDPGTVNNELKRIFKEDPEKKTQRVLVGERRLIDLKLVEDLRKGKYKGQTLWLNGVEVKVDENTISDLEWRNRSGDKVFIGHVGELKREDAGRKLKGPEVAVLTQIAPEIDNVFVSTDTVDVSNSTASKISRMLDQNTWDRLADTNVSVKQIIREFNEGLRATNTRNGQDVSTLNRHLIETERVGLMIMAEAHKLGWGFNYKEKGVKSKRSSVETKIRSRERSMGTPHSASDLGVLDWLAKDADNTIKIKPNSMFPLDTETCMMINEHEPGWAPKWNHAWDEEQRIKGIKGDHRWWKDVYQRHPNLKWNTDQNLWFTKIKMNDDPKNDRFYITDIPTQFNMGMLETVSINEPSPELQKFAGYKNKIYPIELIKKGMRMSEIPWDKIPADAQNLWFVKLGKMGNMEGVFGGKLDEQSVRKYFGDLRAEGINREGLEALNKDLSAAVSELPGNVYKKLLPHVFGLYAWWKAGGLRMRTGRDYVYYGPGGFKNDITEIKKVLEEVAPYNNPNINKETVDRLDIYANQLDEMARADVLYHH